MKNTIKNIFFIIIFLAMIFQNLVINIFPLFNYIDEIIAIIFFVIFMLKVAKDNFKIKMSKNDIKILLAIALIVIIGILGNFIYEIQSPIYVLIDIMSCIKVYLVYVCLHYDIINFKSKKNILELISIIYIVVAFVFGILNLFVDIGMDYGTRYGIKAFKFLYNNPYSLIIPLVIFIGILSLNKNKYIVFIAMALATMILTLRFAGIAAVGIYIFINIILKMKKTKKLNFINLFFVGIIILLIGYNQINSYFIQIESARKGLIEKSITIANDYFPIGPGFGTYASYSSRKSYSRLYYEYGLYIYHGLSEVYSAFITDVYWPMILGQFGWFGLMLVILIYYEIYKDIRESKFNQFELYFIFIFIIISTAGSQTMASLGGVMLVILLRYLMSVNENNKELKYNEIRTKEE